jgi:hypothetical protein
MSTQCQVEANRRNSQLSTGPRTSEGKAASRFNALKTGINANAQVIPGEDPTELEAIAAGYHEEWAPATYLERFLVDSLVRADWLLQRLSRLEAQLWIVGQPTSVPGFPNPAADTLLGQTYTRTLDHFTRLQRRIDSTERSYYRALNQLQRLRRERDSAAAPREPSDPAPEPSRLAPERAPALPLTRMELASFCTSPLPPSLAPLHPWMKSPPARKLA